MLFERRAYSTWQDAENHRRALAKLPAWNQFSETYRPFVNESHTALLKPSPVPWMRALFATIDWSLS
jgi:hypothetical protein